MNHAAHNKLVSFIWSIADDCLRDVYVRGKYRDVILPMVVLRRLDTLLEPTKEAVLEEVHFQRGEMQATELDDAPLMAASGYVFYNTSKWTLKQLYATATNNQQILLANVEEYLGGFSDNVKEIIARFKLQEQMRHMANKQVLLDVLEKFISPYINLTPADAEDPEGNIMPGLSNLGMGYVFEELIRKFNEENNEEAGEHFTPREVIHVMTHLIFDPIRDRLPPVMTIYDPACGSGGMLTEAQNYIKETGGPIAANGDVYLYGKEINDETYAICKSDMMIKGNNPENIKVGSTLATDEFSGQRFDFMLSNPPYGKSWKSDIKHIKDNDEVIDPRFRVQLTDYWGNAETVDATPRSSDGQLLFLMEMVAKMKPIAHTPIGSRIASIHNGSSLFTGDAGSGESNIRRFIIENDMLDAIIQMPNNMFYNTGITTYIWLLSNAKPEARRGKVQLIDASLMFRKLRKNLGDKNCEFVPEHIEEITAAYLAFQQIERKLDANGDPNGIAVQIFDNTDFGYHKVTIERPDRRRAQFSAERLEPLRFEKSLREPMEHLWAEHGEKVYAPGFLKIQAKAIQTWCEEQEIALNAKQRAKLVDTAIWLRQRELIGVGHELMQAVGTAETADFNAFRTQVGKIIKARQIKLTATEKNAILNAVSWYADDAEKVIDGVRRFTRAELEAEAARLGCHVDELGDFGLHAQPDGSYLTFEASTDLRDSEAVPLKDSIHRYFKAEVKPNVPEAWINTDTVKIGYEISFNKHFYNHKSLRSLEVVTQDILSLERRADGLVSDILAVKPTHLVDGSTNLKAPVARDTHASSVPQMPFIPSGWCVARFRHTFNFNKGLTITKENLQDEGIPCVNYGEVHSKYGFEVDPDRHALKYVSPSYLKKGQSSLLKRGDFVFADTSEDIAGSGNFTCYNSDQQAFAGYHTLIAKPKVPMNSRFMAYLLDSASFRSQVQAEVTGVKVFSISQAVLKPTWVWFPPAQEESAIAAFLDDKCAKVDEAVRIKEEQIAALKEYKTSLINAAVTGKIKVA